VPIPCEILLASKGLLPDIDVSLITPIHAMLVVWYIMRTLSQPPRIAYGLGALSQESTVLHFPRTNSTQFEMSTAVPHSLLEFHVRV
jgi:hypothetical protein